MTTKRVTEAEIGDYEGQLPVPTTLPAYKGKPPSAKESIRQALEGLFDGDEVFRQRVVSYSNKSSQTGSWAWDKAFVGAAILKYANEHDLRGLTTKEKPLAVIKHHLNDVLKRYELDRQSRLVKLLEDKRKAEAMQTPEAAE